MSDIVAPRRRRARSGPAATTPDPVEIAMEAEASGKRPSGEAVGLLRDQRRLIGWEIAERRAAFALKLLTVAAGMLAAAVLGAMTWQASRADGLVIQPISVPPDLTARGVTGEVLAGRLMDDMSRIAAIARSAAPERRRAAAFGGGVSIQIPATGVSLDQVDQWLRQRLGHESPLAASVSRNPDGTLILEARVGSDPLPSQTGSEAELPAMLQRTAEALIERDRPPIIMLYLGRLERNDEMLAAARRAVARAPGYGNYVLLAQATRRTKGDAAALPLFERALAMNPAFPPALVNLAGLETNLGHVERACQLYRRAALAYPKWRDGVTDEGRAAGLDGVRLQVAGCKGDLPARLQYAERFARTSNPGGNGVATAPLISAALSRAALHDAAGARAVWEEFVASGSGDTPTLRMMTASDRLTFLTTVEDWEQVPEAADALAAELRASQPDGGALRPQWRWAKAEALMRLGHLPKAAEVLAPTPLDCLPCIRVRGMLAEAQGRHAEADHWFAEAARIGPSLPQAYQYWGRALLARGDPKRAEAKFRASLKIGPRFSDAIEGLGEARLAQGDSNGAATEFQKAAPLTPRWGRLHLKWGEALAAQGKPQEARAKWRAAAGMSLTADELARVTALLQQRTS